MTSYPMFSPMLDKWKMHLSHRTNDTTLGLLGGVEKAEPLIACIILIAMNQ